MYKFRIGYMLNMVKPDGKPTIEYKPSRLGGVLLRTSLSELPEFLNVLRGEMTIVGPRPLPAED